jgi:hypothetical protein
LLGALQLLAVLIAGLAGFVTVALVAGETSRPFAIAAGVAAAAVVYFWGIRARPGTWQDH